MENEATNTDINILGRKVPTDIAIVSIIAIAVFLIYLPALKNGFVCDDLAIIKGNENIRSLDKIPSLLVSEDTVPGLDTGFYRPMTYLTYMMDYFLWDFDPMGYHLTNLILHMLTVVLFYYFSRRFLEQRLHSAIATSLFAFSPLHIETVNFIAGGRNTMLCAAFMLGAILCHIRGRKTAAFLLFIPSVFSKEFSLFMPLFLFIHLRTSSPSATSRNIIRELLPYILVDVFYLAVRTVVFHGAGFNKNVTLNASFQGLLLLPNTFMTYIKMFLLPYNPAFPHIPSNLSSTIVLLSTIMFLALIAVIYFFRRYREGFLCSLWMFIFFIPVSGIIPFGGVRIAERYVYISSMGFYIIVPYLLRNIGRTVLAGLIITLLLSYGYAILDKTPYWYDEHSLFTLMVLNAPESVESFFSLSGIYYANGDVKKSIYYLKKAIAIDPDDARMKRLLASLYESTGDINRAEPLKKQVVALKPFDFQHMRPGITKLYGQGTSMMENGRLEEALKRFQFIEMYESAIPDILFKIGFVFTEKADYKKAADYFKRITILDPDSTEAHFNLSLAYQIMGRREEAIQEMKKYLELEGKPTLETETILK